MITLLSSFLRSALILLVGLLSTTSAAQLFNGVNYQAVVRDLQGDPMPNSAVTLFFQVRQGSTTGPVVFQDTHNTTTNDQGLVSVVIGKGSSTVGDLSTLDYAGQDHFLQVFVDGTGLPQQRIEAVPMALKATAMGMHDLADVDTSGTDPGDVLQWDGSSWKPVTNTGGSGGSLWTENTANGIESLTRNVAIGSNAHNNKRLFIECDSMPTGILVINNDQSTGPEIPQGIVSLVTVSGKSEGSALTGFATALSNATDSLWGAYTLADGAATDSHVMGAFSSAVGSGPGNKYGVYGRSNGPNAHGVFGITLEPDGFGIYGRNGAPGGVAGYFDGRLITDDWLSVNDELIVKPSWSNGAVELEMKNAAAVNTVELFAAGTQSGGGKIWVSDAGGSTRIALNVNSSGIGRVITDELEIRGGADLAEHFTVSVPEGLELVPGTLVSIAPDGSGHLEATTSAYDHRVAGVVSGANGVKPGLTLRQEGTTADGEVPVALNGRVHVLADATSFPIAPGDLLTSSDLPGHAMKAADRDRAPGTVIGKAMTSLSSGTGLVLVLVNLQ